MNNTEQCLSVIEKELEAIKQRNKKVEANKAWEISWIRRISIAAITYVTIVIFFTVADLPRPFISACIPMLGYLLSTLTVRVVRKVWERGNFC